MTIRDRIRAAISDSYYDARNDGLTMEHAADQATAKVMVVLEDLVVDLNRDMELRRVAHEVAEEVLGEDQTVLYVVEKTDG